MKSTNLVTGLLAGALVGAVAALLFAPHKGSLTRKIITRKGEEYADLLEEKVEDLLVAIDSQIKDVKKEVAGFVKRETLKAHEHSKNGHSNL
jgi:gas vesicle protein